MKKKSIIDVSGPLVIVPVQIGIISNLNVNINN